MKKPFIFVGILIVSLSFKWASAFLPIDESDQGNKARIAYSLAKEVSKNAKVSGTYYSTYWSNTIFNIVYAKVSKIIAYDNLVT